MAPTGKSIVQPLLVASLLAIGLGVVWISALAWTAGFVAQSLAVRGTYQQLWIRADGTPLIATYGGLLPGEYSLRTLDGREIPAAREIDRIGGPSFPWLAEEDPSWDDLSWSSRIMAYNDGNRPPAYWYLVHDGRMQGRCYFVGFDSASKRRLGYIGAAGFRPDQPPPQDCFPVDGRLVQGRTVTLNRGWYNTASEPVYGNEVEKVTMVSANRMLEVDLRTRTVRTLLELEGGPLMGIGELSRNRKAADGVVILSPYLVTRTADRIVLLDAKTRAQQSYPMPPETRGHGLDFYRLQADGSAIVDVALALRWRLGEEPHALFWLDAAGKVTRRRAVVLERSRTVLDDPRVGVWMLVACLPAPLALTIVDPMAAADTMGGNGGNPTAFQAWRRGLTVAWPALLAGALLGVAAAWRCYRRQVRYVQPRTAAWVVFVFLLGIPGYWGYRWHRRWPVLSPCPHCGAIAPRDREHCAYCGREFPPPPARQIEVFAA